MPTYSKAVEKEIQLLEDQIIKLDRRKGTLERLIEDLKIGESPIQPGCRITWKSGTVDKSGEVVSIKTAYNDAYQYRCLVMQGGKPVGFATVNEDHQPTLVSKPKKLAHKPRTRKTRKSTK